MKILFVADYSLEEIPRGGAERVDDVLITELGADFQKSFFFTSGEGYDRVILSNFWGLNPKGREWILKNGEKVFLIEHDAKIFPGRIPVLEPTPETLIINVDLYRAVKKVIFQSHFQAAMFAKVIELENPYILGANIWSDDELDFFKHLPDGKNGRCAILRGSAPTKGFEQALQMAEILRLPVDILENMPYHDFVRKLSQYSNIMLTPLVAESFGRCAAEARMMGVLPITNYLMACTHEEWYHWDRFEIIELMRKKRNDLVEFLKS